MYIFETNLLTENTLTVALTQVFGLGKSSALVICKKLGVCSNFKVRNMTLRQQQELVASLPQLDIKINSGLKQKVNYHCSKLIKIKSYRGLRGLKGFPVRGQRTRSNAQTSKKLQ